MTKMYCADCGRIESDPIALDAERCLQCGGGILCQHEPGVDIIHQRSTKIGDVEVIFSVGRIRPKDQR